MKKLLRHKWIKQDGFRVHKCNCGVVRHWNEWYIRLMYRWIENGVPKNGYNPPECKRIMHCDKIENNKL